MRDDEDLNLNTLGRFQKQSERLVLEEHGHCEIPAGCGGVVLRWRDPSEGIPVIFRFWSSATARCFIDGREIASSRATLAFGEHELLIELQEFREGPDILLGACRRDAPRSETGGEDGTSWIKSLCTSGDGSWEKEYAGKWIPLQKPWRIGKIPESEQWQYEALADETPAMPLRLRSSGKPLVIRKKFQINEEAS